MATKGWAEPAAVASEVRCAVYSTAGNEQIFRTQLRALIERLEDKVEFQFISGRLRMDETEGSELTNGIVKTMKRFFGEDQILTQYGVPTFDSNGWRGYDDLDDAVRYLDDQIQSLPGGIPDAVLGFSQVAALLHCSGLTRTAWCRGLTWQRSLQQSTKRYGALCCYVVTHPNTRRTLPLTDRHRDASWLALTAPRAVCGATELPGSRGCCGRR